MKRQFIVIGFIAMALVATICNLSFAAKAKIAYISMGDVGPFTELAMEFAQKTFDTTVLTRDDLKSIDFTKFAVVWWHDGDSDPGPLNEQEMNAFVKYAEAGGAILLSAWAIRYATPMGLEDAEARQFGPVADDGINVGITLLDEMMNLPLWKGLKNLDGDPPKAGDRVQVNSTGYPKSGDYWSNIWKNFITVAHAWGPPADNWGDQIAAFGYWELGDGKVFNMNWRLPNFHENNKDIGMLEILTTNVVNWLAIESAFYNVELYGKSAATWGRIKSHIR